MTITITKKLSHAYHGDCLITSMNEIQLFWDFKLLRHKLRGERLMLSVNIRQHFNYKIYLIECTHFLIFCVKLNLWNYWVTTYNSINNVKSIHQYWPDLVKSFMKIAFFSRIKVSIPFENISTFRLSKFTVLRNCLKWSILTRDDFILRILNCVGFMSADSFMTKSRSAKHVAIFLYALEYKCNTTKLNKAKNTRLKMFEIMLTRFI